MYDWGPVFIAWAVTILIVTALVVVGGVVALIADWRRNRASAPSRRDVLQPTKPRRDAKRLARV